MLEIQSRFNRETITISVIFLFPRRRLLKARTRPASGIGAQYTNQRKLRVQSGACAIAVPSSAISGVWLDSRHVSVSGIGARGYIPRSWRTLPRYASWLSRKASFAPAGYGRRLCQICSRARARAALFKIAFKEARLH